MTGAVKTGRTGRNNSVYRSIAIAVLLMLTGMTVGLANQAEPPPAQTPQQRVEYTKS